MIRRALTGFAFLSLCACSGEKLTGVAAENAARQYQAQASTIAEEPLFLLDGKEVSAERVRAMDPKTIHSVEVLKGATAFQRYGERARHGVVLVTSKSGPGAGSR